MDWKGLLKFGPNTFFEEINWDNEIEVIKQFRDRVDGFYLQPAKRLGEDQYGFAHIIVLIAVMEFLTNFWITPKGRMPGKSDGFFFKEWLKEKIPQFRRPVPNGKRDYAYWFWENFRCSLVHNGFINALGQLSYEEHEIVSMYDEVMVVNPAKLQEAVELACEDLCTRLEQEYGVRQRFIGILKKRFGGEVERAIELVSF